MEKLISAFYKRGRLVNKTRRISSAIIGFVVFRVNGCIISPAVVYYFDHTTSLVLNNLILLLISYTLIRLYDFQKNDVLFLENYKRKSVRNEEIKTQNSITKNLLRFSKYGKKISYLVVLFMGPLITAIYFRHGYALYNSIPNAKIGFLFILSSVLCNTLWVYVLEFVFLAWKNIQNIF